MTYDTDILILGGGCAGLSLATALTEQGCALRTTILEARERYVRDRTWCLWNTEPHPFDNCVTHRWKAWSVSDECRSVIRSSEQYAYEHIPADRFYKSALERIESSGTQHLCRGVKVESVLKVPNGYKVESSLGSLFARHVFDSRPPQAAARENCWMQRFTGWHVRTQEPVFDTTTVELMSFQPFRVEGRIVFFYVLPFTRNEALVEATCLDMPGLSQVNLELDLATWLTKKTSGKTYEILFGEQGALAMGEASAAMALADDGYNIGIRGGRVKPSSGYAFLRIQRQSRALAEAIAKSHPLPRQIEPAYYARLDSIFLRALSQRPANAPDYFFRLFSQVPSDVLVRFLSESGSLLESVRTALALPSLSFLRAAVASRGGR